MVPSRRSVGWGADCPRGGIGRLHEMLAGMVDDPVDVVIATRNRPGIVRQHSRRGGDTHNRALRALANRLVGILHGCLRHQTQYDEHTAWAHRQQQAV